MRTRGLQRRSITLARVMTPNCPKPQRTTSKRSRLLLARADHHLAGAGDHLELGDVVGLQAVAEAGDADAGHRHRAGDADAEVVGEHPRHQVVLARRGDEVAPDDAALHVGQHRLAVDGEDLVHAGDVEQHAAGVGRLAALAVPLRARRDGDAVGAAEAHQLGHLFGGARPRHRGGGLEHPTAVVAAIALARLAVERHPVGEAGLQLVQRLADCRGAASGCLGVVDAGLVDADGHDCLLSLRGGGPGGPRYFSEWSAVSRLS